MVAFYDLRLVFFPLLCMRIFFIFIGTLELYANTRITDKTVIWYIAHSHNSFHFLSFISLRFSIYACNCRYLLLLCLSFRRRIHHHVFHFKLFIYKCYSLFLMIRNGASFFFGLIFTGNFLFVFVNVQFLINLSQNVILGKRKRDKQVQKCMRLIRRFIYFIYAISYSIVVHRDKKNMLLT